MLGPGLGWQSCRYVQRMRLVCWARGRAEKAAGMNHAQDWDAGSGAGLSKLQVCTTHEAEMLGAGPGCQSCRCERRARLARWGRAVKSAGRNNSRDWGAGPGDGLSELQVRTTHANGVLGLGAGLSKGLLRAADET